MKYRDFTKEELNWIQDFKKIMKKAPNTLLLFVAGDILIGTKDKNNNRYMLPSGSVDSEANWIQIQTKMEVDGGDW